MAPYFLAMASRASCFACSPEIELISARPGYLRSAASSTSTWLESMDRGRLVTPLTVSMAFSIMAFSSMPLIPMFTSRMLAPQASCASAKSDTSSRDPSLSAACSFFFPVGFMRSPTTIKGSSSPNATVCRSLVKNRFSGFTRCMTAISCTAAFAARICAGVVPQQPPSTEAPAETRSRI